MEASFTEVMSKRTDEQLVKIVTVDRSDYQPIAVEAAEKEIEKRNIDVSKFEEIRTAYTKLADEQKQIETNQVDAATRVVHFIVDRLAISIIAIVLGLPLVLLLMPKQNSRLSERQNPLLDPNLDLLGYLLFVILVVSFFGYYVFMETRYQKTLGKFITKTKVIMKDGQKPKAGDIIKRTIFRLIPLDSVSYVFAVNGFHDYLSNTTVVKD